MPSWSDILEELHEEDGQGEKRSRSSLDTVRRKCLRKLSDRAGRNTAAYYSGWLTKPDLRQTGTGDELGLNVTRLEDDDGLQDLVLTVRHACMHTLTKGLPH